MSAKIKYRKVLFVGVELIISVKMRATAANIPPRDIPEEKADIYESGNFTIILHRAACCIAVATKT